MELSAIILQNPWWRNPLSINEDRKVRTALESTPQYIYQFRDENLLIIGPRQAGKTTFVKLGIRDLIINKRVDPKNIIFLSCDFVDNRDDLLQALFLFEEQSDKKSMRYIFLDEISFVKDWNVLVLGLFNSGFLENKRIYLTGSSFTSLLKETFPGREITRRVFLPLQFREYFNTFYEKIPLEFENVNLEDIRSTYEKSLTLMPYISDLNRALLSYVMTGGLLAPSYSFKFSGHDPLDSLFETYRDASISDIAKLERSQKFFREILNVLVTSYSTRLSANSIASKTSVGSHKTVESYLELMEQLFLIKIVYLSRDGKVSLRSNRKVYFLDPFIYRILKLYSTGISEYGENEVSKIIEAIVGTHLANLGNEIYYQHTKSGKEVDFLINNICVEVKWGNRDTRQLFCEKGYLLTRDAIPGITGERASIPVSIFLYMNSAVNPLR